MIGGRSFRCGGDFGSRFPDGFTLLDIFGGGVQYWYSAVDQDEPAARARTNLENPTDTTTWTDNYVQTNYWYLGYDLAYGDNNTPPNFDFWVHKLTDPAISSTGTITVDPPLMADVAWRVFTCDRGHTTLVGYLLRPAGNGGKSPASDVQPVPFIPAATGMEVKKPGDARWVPVPAGVPKPGGDPARDAFDKIMNVKCPDGNGRPMLWNP